MNTRESSAFRVMLVRDGRVAGIAPKDVPDQTVTYSGERLSIKL